MKILTVSILLALSSPAFAQTYNPVASDITTQNTAVGSGTLSAGAGARNTAMGKHAGWSMVDGYDNVLLGYRAGFQITTGDANTGTGAEALVANKTGNGNSALGFGAGWNINGVGSDYNIYVGWGAGQNQFTGHHSIYIGSRGGAAGDESSTIRIGEPGTQTRFFAAGIKNVKLTGKVVVITNGGQLAESPQDLLLLIQQLQARVTALETKLSTMP